MFREKKDLLWLTIWLAGLAILWLWDAIFLNAPAFSRLQTAFANSVLSGAMVVTFSLILGWLTALTIHALDRSRSKIGFAIVSFITDILRSVPQIIAVLIGYVGLTILLHNDIIRSTIVQLVWIAGCITIAVFLEVSDTVRARIEYFRRSDFVDAMLCCGISERRIINVEILWKNSRSHLLHKAIAIFGASIFLQCSIDFIVSVGLSTDVSLTNFPTTLGNLLANTDSKQDILALSNLFTNPAYLPNILMQHLQGVSVAVCIVFSLLCIYRIANGFVRRHKLA